MKNVFNCIANIIEKRSIKTLLATMLIFAIMMAGATQIRMATGSNTLVKDSSDVYKSNLAMEADFGGDSVVVLFEGETQKNILSIENIEKMWNVEQALKQEEDVFSVMGPSSIVNQMATKQSEEIKKQILIISQGLSEMSGKMSTLGEELSGKEIKDPKEIEEMISNLSNISSVFDKLIIGQNEMATGAGQLQNSIGGVAEGLSSVSAQLDQMANNLQDTPQIAKQLYMISENINQSANGLKTMGSNTSNIKQGNEQTSSALTNIKNQLNSQTSGIKGSMAGGLSPDKLSEMAESFILMGEKLAEISEGLKVFHEKSQMMIADIPKTQSELDNMLYDENLNLRAVLSNIIVDENHAVMMIKVIGNLEDSKKDVLYEKLQNIMAKQEFEDINYIISGKPVLDTALRSEMKLNMRSMVILAVALMFIILLIIFKVKWRALSLGIIFTAVIATLGFMGLVGIPMTMVSMAVFPILIGLGIDYSIQFHNRYEEEHSTKNTLIQMGPAVGTATFATVLGFIALYASPVPMVQDFGKMLTIGVIISYVASVFLLMPILKLRDKFSVVKEKNKKKETIESSKLENALKNVTRGVLKYSWAILIITTLVAGSGILVDNRVGVETDIETFMPQDTQQLVEIRKLRDTLGSTNQIALYMEDDNILKEENIKWMEEKTKEIESKFSHIVVDIKSITTVVSNIKSDTTLIYSEYIDTINSLPLDQRKMFINEDQSKGVILLNIKHIPIEEIQEFVRNIEYLISDSAMDIKVTGKSVLDVEMINGLTSGRVKMTFLGIAFVFIGLLIIYRNIVKAFIPVFPISLIVGMSGGIMYLLDLKYTPLTSTLGALILGIGTEMTILLLERYIEERVNGYDKKEAMETAVAKIGSAILASGITTIGGFGVLMISKFVILKDFGLMTVINMSLALFSTLIILPPLIVLLDRFILPKDITSKIQS